MKKTAAFYSLAACAALLAFSSANASVGINDPGAVTPGDTFVFSLLGANAAGNNPVVLIQPLTATFGQTQTLSGTGAGGAQSVTVATVESIGASTTTDTITISVPTNFVPAGTVNSGGGNVSLIRLNVGGFTAGTNTLDFLLPVTSPGYAAIAVSGTANTITTLGAANYAATLSNGDQSLAYAEGISTGSAASISSMAVHSFTFSVTYNTVPVPEPSSLVLGGLALAGGCAGWLRRRRKAVQSA